MGTPSNWRVAGAVLAFAISTALPAAEEAIPAKVEFNRDIRPILSDKCYACHGPGRQSATIRFDREEGAKHALNGGRFAVVPGDPSKSSMINRITGAGPGARMPLNGEPLSAREVDIIKKWIEQGATWQQHWSFIPPVRPELPKVSDAKWPRNGIDNFVLARLDKENLKPSPQADRVTLLRRVTFDLTGLPPTTAEIDAFVNDKSANAYEKVVDRLLASPRYGERMAFTWLEAARYADTSGYQSDGERFMWRWRDYVINAFNSNMRYDRFTTEQIAGDLLPNATLEQKIATGFNRNHRGNAEGGIVPEEYQVEYVLDRVDTTGTVFLGLTLGCVRCHDHKYDPITQRDNYSIFAYFNNIPESGKARRYGNSPPFIQAPLPEHSAKLKQLDDAASAAAKKFTGLESKLVQAQKAWERTTDKSKVVHWGPSRDLMAHYPFNGEFKAKTFVADKDAKPASNELKDGSVTLAKGRLGQAASFDGKAYIQDGDVAGFSSNGYQDDPITLAAWIYPTAATGSILSKSQDVTEPEGYGFQLKDGKLQFNYVDAWFDDGIRIETEKTVDLNQWHQVTAVYDGGRYAANVKLYVDGQEWKFKVLLDDINNSQPLKREPLRIGAGGGPQNRFHGSIEDVRIYKRALPAAEVAVLADPTPVNEIAAMPEAQRSKAQSDKLHDYYLENLAPAEIKTAYSQMLDTRAKRDAYSMTIPTVMVMEELSTPRESHVLIRGEYNRPGDKVSPRLPAFLVPPDANSKYPPNRLGLAQWLVDPSNPLMSRVTVNRFWQQYFGVGLVKTVEDFGSQGDAPSNQELLDWLATEFIRIGWDVKGFQKTIVMSATYQQSSKTTPEMVQRDPENRLFSRGPRFRLTAPMVRDQALAVSGLLVNQIGGPSVMPYQPDGLWADLSAAKYVQDHGEKLYRRSLYTFWKRTIPPPTMANFDAAARESHVVRQTITNTPLQALDLMNDVAFLEAARVLAQKAMAEGGAKPEDRIRWTFRRITGRTPSAKEVQMLLESFNFQLDAFQSKPEAALKYLNQGEYPRDQKLNVSQLAAYSTLTSFIMNLDETNTKE